MTALAMECAVSCICQYSTDARQVVNHDSIMCCLRWPGWCSFFTSSAMADHVMTFCLAGSL